MGTRLDPHWVRCEQCGKAFKALRSDAKTCSRLCRNRRARGEKPYPGGKRKAVA